MKPIEFSDHAELKFDILRQHGFHVAREDVLRTMKKPERIEPSHGRRNIAQRALDAGHVLRVVFEDLPDVMRIITFYPGRRERYED
jgi:hypothetical protein